MQNQLIEKLKVLFKGHPDAEALIAQAVAEGEAGEFAIDSDAPTQEAAPLNAEAPAHVDGSHVNHGERHIDNSHVVLA